MSSPFALSINNLSYVYIDEWTRKKKNALSSLSLDITQGECFGFLGHNGAGKTTTIKSILGFIRPTSGQITLFGVPSSERVARKSLGYLPEQPYFYDYLTVHESLTLYGTLAELSKRELAARIEELSVLLQLQDRLPSRMRTLSKGTLQRVALAQALLHRPKLLLLDEPFSGLDPIGRKEFRDILLSLKREGTTIFMASHILSDVEFLCDRASILSQGVLKGIVSLGEFRESSGGHFDLLLGTNKVSEELQKGSLKVEVELDTTRLLYQERIAAETALHIALHQGIKVYSFTYHQPSLEEVFVKLIKGEEKGPCEV